MMSNYQQHNNISKFSNCYGCGVCASACPKRIINIVQNTDGFYEPQLTDSCLCTNCGLCLKTCSYTKDSIAQPEPIYNSYAAWSNNSAVRERCSSGGVAFEIEQTLIKDGYLVCAVKYNVSKNIAEHYVASSVEDLYASIGSKYIQSYTPNAFLSIDRNKKYIIIGTPCQIDSFRKFIQVKKCEDNFILMDFFCHGVPSKIIWDKYVKETEVYTGKIQDISWRNKKTGWHDSWAMSIKGEKQDVFSRYSDGDIFYKLFLGNSCLGKACYNNCKYKGNNSSADIRIGDMWGKEFAKNEEGISSVISFTKKGDDILHQTNCTLIKYPYEVVSEAQMHEKLKEPFYRKFILCIAKSRLPLKYALYAAQFFRLPTILKYKLHIK